MGGIDLHDVRQIVLNAPGSAGGAFLSDVAFQSSGAGSGGPSALPQVSIAGYHPWTRATGQGWPR